MNEVLLIAIILAPLFASLSGYLLRSSSSVPSLLGAGISLLSALVMVFSLGTGGKSVFRFGGLADQTFLLQADHSSAILSVVVAVVAMVIFVYAKGYMAGETGASWFWPAIALFLGAMQLLVLAGDWFLFITGWEIMGLSSFLLIATWHEKEGARKGAGKAFLLTRFTDIGLYAGIFLVIISFNSLSIPEISEAKISTIAALWLLLAVMGKSAQVPFQSWLSGAMAGPTPVSALLHSATMVGAGALLLFKVSPWFNDQVLFITAITGSVTIILTGLTAILSKDIKQMLAASTSSQLGFMLLAIGTGHPGAAFAHWIAHAFMKSSLFLGAGVFQHAYDSTTFEKLSGSGQRMKFTFLCFAVAAVGLVGVPPLIGFWSKDGILAATYAGDIGFFIIAVLGALFTAMYMGKALSWLWNGNAEVAVVPGKKLMIVGLGILALFVAVGGFFLEPLVKWTNYEIAKDMPSKIIGLLAAVTGLFTGWWFKDSWIPERISRLIRENYPVSGGYEALIAIPVLRLARLSYVMDMKLHASILKLGQWVWALSRSPAIVDNGIQYGVDKVGQSALATSELSEQWDRKTLKSVMEVARVVKESGRRGKKWQSGLVHKELAITITGILILIFVLTLTLIQL